MNMFRIFLIYVYYTVCNFNVSHSGLQAFDHKLAEDVGAVPFSCCPIVHPKIDSIHRNRRNGGERGELTPITTRGCWGLDTLISYVTLKQF